MATSPNPFYGTQTDLTQPVSTLARAMVGSPADDAYMARSQASQALGRKYDLEANQLRDLEESRRRLAQSPEYQKTLAAAFGFQPGAEGALPPEIADVALQYLARGGNIENFAKANRTTQGVGGMQTRGATEGDMRIAGALLGLEPDKNTAYTVPRADAILEGDYAVRRRGQDVTASTTRRGQDITDTTNRRGQDMRSDDTRRGQDLRSDDTRRGQDVRQQTALLKPSAEAKPVKLGKNDYEIIQGELTRLAGNADLSVDQPLFDRIFENSSRLAQTTKDPRTAAAQAWREALADPSVVNERSTFLGMTVGKGKLKQKEGGAAPAAAPAKPAGNAPVIDKLPEGAKQIGTSGGKPVYELNGKRYIQD